MKRRPSKIRKRRPVQRVEFQPRSAVLRAARDHIARRQFADGLQKLNALLAQNPAPALQAQALALAADSEFKRGRFAEAAAAHRRAAALCAAHPLAWLRPRFGEVRALLKAVEVDAAYQAAQECVALCAQKNAAFVQQSAQAAAALAAQGTAPVPQRPQRVAVVTTRFGQLFLREGEIDAAQQLFTQALAAAPGGASRARQGLAAIALRHGDGATARQRAVESLTIGKFQAKTLGAWPLLFAALRQTGADTFPAELLTALATARPSIRARATLLIVRELRRSGSPQWTEVAQSWLQREGAQFSVIATELQKLFVATTRLAAADPLQQHRQALALAQLPNLSANEWLAAAKEAVSAGLLGGQEIAPETWLQEAVTRFGGTFAAAAGHSLALACLSAKRPDLARQLLLRNLQQLPATHPVFGKTLWALARLESTLKRHDESAAYFLRLSEQPSVGIRYRLQALVEWAKEIAVTTRPDEVAAARPRILALMASVQNSEVILSFARQLSTGPSAVSELAEDIFRVGESRMRAEFNAATHPAQALQILWKLTHRQRDFERYADIVSIWEHLGDKKDFLWSGATLFWEYLALVSLAYFSLGRSSDANQMCQEYLADPATPVDGIALLNFEQGTWKLRHNQKPGAIVHFQKTADCGSSHPITAYANYWLAVHQAANGNREGAAARALLTRSLAFWGGKSWQKAVFELSALILNIDPKIGQHALTSRRQELDSDIQFFR